MKQKIIQSSCSELLVDTAIYDPKEAYEKFSSLFKEFEWESSPPLSLELLKEIKDIAIAYHKEKVSYEEYKDKRVIVYDKYGNRAYLEYGRNGYIETGFRFDSDCNHGDDKCFPIFQVTIDKLSGELICCDGGSTNCYEEWRAEQK